MRKRTRSFTLDNDVLDRIEQESKDVGLSANGFLNTALRTVFGLPTKEEMVAIRFNKPMYPVQEKPKVEVKDGDVAVDLSTVESKPERQVSGRREVRPFKR